MPFGIKSRVKAVLGGPMSKQGTIRIPLTRQMLEEIGDVMVKCIVEEAKKDLAKQPIRSDAIKQPEGIPDSENFFKSFGYQIKGRSTIEITSSWPWIEQITEGVAPFKMDWLTQANGARFVPLRQRDGTVIIRLAPRDVGSAWIHPGFARHTFIQRGIRKAKKEMAEILKPAFIDALNGR